MDYLVFSKVTAKTGQLLAEKLGIRCGETIPNEPIRVLIRWGATVASPRRPELTLNKRDAIVAAADKLGAVKRLTEAGVLCPDVLGIQDVARQQNPADFLRRTGWEYPFLARKLHHTRGKDILLCLQNKDVERAIRWGKDYLSKYVPTAREYRVHVFNGEIIRVSQKVLMSRHDYVPYLRNDDNNHTYRNPRIELREQDIAAAKKAVATLGLDFAAIDLIVGDDDLPYVLEANTGPSLIEIGVEVYSDCFQTILNGA